MLPNGRSKKRNEMRKKIKNILSSSYTKQGEFNEGKALNELCVLLGVSNHVVCDECGDTGRGKPTLQEPDGIGCEKCSSK
jgi:hypothetical protein